MPAAAAGDTTAGGVIPINGPGDRNESRIQRNDGGIAFNSIAFDGTPALHVRDGIECNGIERSGAGQR